MARLDVIRVCTVVKKRGGKGKGKGRNYTAWVAMKSTELKIKLCVCVLAQQHIWEGVQRPVLPSMRPDQEQHLCSGFLHYQEADRVVQMTSLIRRRRRAV